MKVIFQVIALWGGSGFANYIYSQNLGAFVHPRIQSPDAPIVDTTRHNAILLRSDPGTHFLRYAFGLKQNAAKLLSMDQAAKLNTIIDHHSPIGNRWHDDRNALRCKFNEVMWLYAGAEAGQSDTYREELKEWMRWRMLWTQQEHLAQFRFASDVWNVLDANQQQQLISGAMQSYAKQDTGHTRGNATARIIVRAIGRPDRKADFDAAVAKWTKEREPLHKAVNETENNERRIVFAMDINSEAMAYHAGEIAADAYSKLYLTEADAMRTIVQAGYPEPIPACEKAAEEAWSEAPARFEEGASELIRFLDDARDKPNRGI